jgi:hypothetical protein
MGSKYWAVRPISARNQIRIEKADTPSRACDLAFGRGHIAGRWEAKDMGSRLAIIQSDSKRIALLQDPSGWEIIR